MMGLALRLGERMPAGILSKTSELFSLARIRAASSIGNGGNGGDGPSDPSLSDEFARRVAALSSMSDASGGGGPTSSGSGSGGSARGSSAPSSSSGGDSSSSSGSGGSGKNDRQQPPPKAAQSQHEFFQQRQAQLQQQQAQQRRAAAAAAPPSSGAAAAAPAQPQYSFQPGDTYDPSDLNPFASKMARMMLRGGSNSNRGGARRAGGGDGGGGLGSAGRGLRGRRRERWLDDLRGQVDFRNTALLRQFVSDSGRLKPRCDTGLPRPLQRRVARAVKMSRQMALLPFEMVVGDAPSDQRARMLEFEAAKRSMDDAAL